MAKWLEEWRTEGWASEDPTDPLPCPPTCQSQQCDRGSHRHPCPKYFYNVASQMRSLRASLPQKGPEFPDQPLEAATVDQLQWLYLGAELVTRTLLRVACGSSDPWTAPDAAGGVEAAAPPFPPPPPGEAPENQPSPPPPPAREPKAPPTEERNPFEYMEKVDPRPETMPNLEADEVAGKDA